MNTRYSAAAAFALLIGGAALAARAPADDRVDLSSAMEIWGDVLADADGLGLRIAQVSDADEMQLGYRLSGQSPWNLATDDADAQYVSAIAATLTPHVRRKGIRYTTRVVDAPFENAWALPGGQIFVTRRMLTLLQSEAELAAVLGHEIAHVDERHCIARYEYALRLGKVGLGGPGGVLDDVRVVAEIGYSKYQESDADIAGVRLMTNAGYYPVAAADVFARLAAREGQRWPNAAASPFAETARAAAGALESYPRSHPASADRAVRIRARVRSAERRLAGRTFYVGVENFRQRTARTRREFPGERTKIPYPLSAKS